MSNLNFDTREMKIVHCISISLLLFIPNTSSAQLLEDPQLLFKEGNILFEQRDFTGAIAKYEQVLTLGYESGALYYNLGNCYFRLNDIGHSILNYERAKRLLPDDEAVNFNIELANLLAVDRIVTPPQFFFDRAITSFKNLLSISRLSWLVMGLYLLIMILLTLRVFTRKHKVRFIVTTAIILFALPFIIFALTLVMRAHDINTNIEAIVMVDKVSVMSEPSNDATEQFYLHVGAKVQLEDSSGDWVRIRLADGKIGWLLKASLEEI